MYRFSRPLIAVSVMLSLTACTPKGGPPPIRYVTREETVTLQPVATRSFEWTYYRYNSTGHIFCPLDKRGMGSEQPRAGFSGLVGYVHEHEAGTPPLPCDRLLNSSFRAAAKFDLSSIREHAPRVFVKSAQLYFKKQRRDGSGDCEERVLVATEDWTSRPAKIAPPFFSTGFPAAEERYTLPVPPNSSPVCAGLGNICSVPVTNLVGDWVRSTIPNHGIQVAGRVETLRNKDNVHCVTDYGSFELQVTFRFDVPASG